MPMRAIRGATQLDSDAREHLLASVDELIRAILEQNRDAKRRKQPPSEVPAAA